MLLERILWFKCVRSQVQFRTLVMIPSLSLMLRPTVSRPFCLGIKLPSGAYDQSFITVRLLRVCWCGALSLMRGRVCRLQLLLVHASAVIFGSESRGTRDRILLSQIRDFRFYRLLLTLRVTVEVFYPASTTESHLVRSESTPLNKSYPTGTEDITLNNCSMDFYEGVVMDNGFQQFKLHFMY
jgi:hypothetical protein